MTGHPEGESFRPDTLVRIMNGALIALSRHGVRKMSMSDVTEAAGISRGTLYRHFGSKAVLLDAIAAYVQTEVRRELEEAVQRRPALEDRVEVVVGAIVAFADTHPLAVQVLTVEPEFGTQVVRDRFPEFVAAAEALMAPALVDADSDNDQMPSASSIAELALRIAASTYFIPAESVGHIPRAIAAVLSRFTTTD